MSMAAKFANVMNTNIQKMISVVTIIDISLMVVHVDFGTTDLVEMSEVLLLLKIVLECVMIRNIVNCSKWMVIYVLCIISTKVCHISTENAKLMGR